MRALLCLIPILIGLVVSGDAKNLLWMRSRGGDTRREGGGRLENLPTGPDLEGMGKDVESSVFNSVEVSKIQRGWLSLKSVAKLTAAASAGVVLSFLSVVPRTGLSTEEYNSAFKDILIRLGTSLVWPLMLITGLFRHRDANINVVVDVCIRALTVGLPTIWAVQAVLATAIRLIILRVLEPQVFDLCPRVPAIFLPWSLAENNYYPSRTTMLVMSFLNCCIMAPIVEEVLKVVILAHALERARGKKGDVSPSSSSSLTSTSVSSPSSSSSSSSSSPSSSSPLSLSSRRGRVAKRNTNGALLEGKSKRRKGKLSSLPLPLSLISSSSLTSAYSMYSSESGAALVPVAEKSPSSSTKSRAPGQRRMSPLPLKSTPRASELSTYAPKIPSSSSSSSSSYSSSSTPPSAPTLPAPSTTSFAKTDPTPTLFTLFGWNISPVIGEPPTPTKPLNRDWRRAKAQGAKGLSVPPTLHVRSYLIFMLAASLGMKIGDNTRRILLYTSAEHIHKGFFAVARSMHPVRELCGCLSALRWAAKDMLGHESSFLGRVLPSVLLNSMACMRGMKPIYVWQSQRPWDDVNLQVVGSMRSGSGMEILTKAVLNACWIFYLMRVLASVVREYILLSREYYMQLRAVEDSEMQRQRAFRLDI